MAFKWYFDGPPLEFGGRIMALSDRYIYCVLPEEMLKI